MAKTIIRSQVFWRTVFIAPCIILTLFLSYFPLFYSFWISLFRGRILDLRFSGFQNYINLFTDDIFYVTLKNSAFFTVLTVPLIIIFSFMTAIKISALKTEMTRNIITTIMFIPCTISPVAYSLFFKQASYPDGIISNVLRNIGIVNSNFNILQDVWSARFLIIFTCLWAWSGYYILLFTSAISNINPVVYDAAKIDGASNLLITGKIVFPLIAPIFHLLTIMAITGTFQLFIESLLITKGGPGMTTYTLASYLYRRTFVYVVQFGYSSAIANIIFFLLMLVFMVSAKKDYEK